MIRVNLLPHRQAKRAEKQREFGLLSLLIAVACCAILFLAWSVIKAKVETQKQRNQRLEDATLALDTEIKDISGLKEQIKEVLNRKDIVENLQSNRNQAVIVLDELARQIPEGVILRNVKQTENDIELQGEADANARVATLVRNISNSQWFSNPNLVEIKANNGTNKSFNFTLKLSLKAAVESNPELAPKSAS